MKKTSQWVWKKEKETVVSTMMVQENQEKKRFFLYLWDIHKEDKYYNWFFNGGLIPSLLCGFSL